jgi:hypothetical protein
MKTMGQAEDIEGAGFDLLPWTLREIAGCYPNLLAE